MPKFKKQLRNTHSSNPYYYDIEQVDPEDNTCCKTIYDAVKDCQMDTTFEIQGWEPERQIGHIINEIRIRTRISANEIFKIGELLMMLKKICCQEHIRFKEIIETKTDFSYDTAQNFMNVYRYCFSYRDLALNIPPSILYSVATPSFPDELRNWLFESGVIENLKSARLKRLTEKFKEGGLEAVESEVKEIGKITLITRQTNYTFDLCENALRSLNDLINKVECRGGRAYIAQTAYQDQVKVLENEAAEINLRLFNSLQSAYDILDKAVSESREELWDFHQRQIA